MNRQGFLLGEETLKIVIAVICIGVLVYFLVSLYSSHKTNQDLELAKASLQHLNDAINSELSETEIYNPEGWIILSWPYDGKIPLSCSNIGWTLCLCICKNPWIKSSGNYLDNCDDAGICLENSKGFIVGADTPSPINIKNPPIFLKIDKQNKKITLK